MVLQAVILDNHITQTTTIVKPNQSEDNTHFFNLQADIINSLNKKIEELENNSSSLKMQLDKLNTGDADKLDEIGVLYPKPFEYKKRESPKDLFEQYNEQKTFSDENKQESTPSSSSPVDDYLLGEFNKCINKGVHKIEGYYNKSQITRKGSERNNYTKEKNYVEYRRSSQGRIWKESLRGSSIKLAKKDSNVSVSSLLNETRDKLKESIQISPIKTGRLSRNSSIKGISGKHQNLGESRCKKLSVMEGE
jgi:hypothetical protein